MGPRYELSAIKILLHTVSIFLSQIYSSALKPYTSLGFASNIFSLSFYLPLLCVIYSGEELLHISYCLRACLPSLSLSPFVWFGVCFNQDISTAKWGLLYFSQLQLNSIQVEVVDLFKISIPALGLFLTLIRAQ